MGSFEVNSVIGVGQQLGLKVEIVTNSLQARCSSRLVGYARLFRTVGSLGCV